MRHEGHSGDERSGVEHDHVSARVAAAIMAGKVLDLLSAPLD
jgi:hypothetical protein